MKLHEIIETVKHDRDYFEGAETEFQSGRAWEAGKILDMLYKLETAQLQQHGVMQAEGSDVCKHENAVIRDGEFDYCMECCKQIPREGAAVGNSADGQSAVKVKTGTIVFCEGEQFVFGINHKTGKPECFNLYGMSGISDEGALPR